jgi:predicted Ser/Thr protein kinase
MAKTRKRVRSSKNRRKSRVGVGRKSKVGGVMSVFSFLVKESPKVCEKITTVDLNKLYEMFKDNRNSLMAQINTIVIKKDDNDSKHKTIPKEEHIMTIDKRDYPALGAGSFNGVYLGDNILCKGNNFIIRVEKKPHNSPHKNFRMRMAEFIGSLSKSSINYYNMKDSYENKCKEFVNETRLSIIASNAGVGPNIYQFGSTVKAVGLTGFYEKFSVDKEHFYTITQKVNGTDFQKYLDKMKPNDVDNAKKYIDQLIEKSDILGEMGMILQDTKPGNAMVDTTYETVYLIDYDPIFTKYNDQNKKIGYLNSVLMLAMCINQLFLNNNHHINVKNHCIKRLQKIYYSKEPRVIDMINKYNNYIDESNILIEKHQVTFNKKGIPDPDIRSFITKNDDNDLISNIIHYGLVDILIQCVYEKKTGGSDSYQFGGERTIPKIFDHNLNIDINAEYRSERDENGFEIEQLNAADVTLNAADVPPAVTRL